MTTARLTARGAPGRAPTRPAAPVAHVAIRSWRTTTPSASVARPSRAAISSGRAMPAASRAEREAGGGGDAVGDPARRDQRQAGQRRRARPTTARAVGTPQSANAAATAPARVSRRPSTSAQLVPPAPATSTAATPARASASTSSGSIPKPTSLTTHRQRRERGHRRGDAVEHVAEGRLALGLHGLLDRVEVDGQPVGAEQLDELRRARSGSSPTPPRLASSSGGRSPPRARRCRAGPGRRAARGPSRASSPRRAARRPRPASALIASRLRRPAGHRADHQRRARARRRGSDVASETSARSRPGSARWRSRTRVQAGPGGVQHARSRRRRAGGRPCGSATSSITTGVRSSAHPR